MTIYCYVNDHEYCCGAFELGRFTTKKSSWDWSSAPYQWKGTINHCLKKVITQWAKPAFVTASFVEGDPICDKVFAAINKSKLLKLEFKSEPNINYHHQSVKKNKIFTCVWKVL